MSLIEKALQKASTDAAAPPSIVEQAMAVAASGAEEASSPAQPAMRSTPGVNIDLARLEAAGFVTPDTERTELAEEFRLIKRPLLQNAFGPGNERVPRGNLIMITSALPGEGKTFCAINLAISIALEMDRTVLLVDADVAKPTLMSTLGVRATGEGLLDVLREPRLGLPDVLLRTNIEKLTLLPPGKPYKHATELLASQAMNALLDDIANRYSDRVVLFDSPPLLATSEASVLASHMGQIVLVVEADRTPQTAVREALGQIEDSGAAIGFVLNKTTAPQLAGSYYGYGYGKYGT